MHSGDVIADRFELRSRAGAGGMGEVWRALDRTSGAEVGLKRLHRDDHRDVERFRREAQTLGELVHPGIVRYVAHGVAPDSSLFLAMEWLQGETLQARLGRGPVAIEDALHVVRRAALALAFAHARGVVHRDVKPSNLFLVEGDPARTKVLDFGLATNKLVRLTRTGALVGTVGYMAPEQAMGAREVDPRVDVFALGCVLFECLTGRPAFEGEHQAAVLCKLLLDEVPCSADVGVDLPPEIDALLVRLLAKDPAERPTDGAEVASAIEALTPCVTQLPRDRPAPARSPRPAVGIMERRWLSVIVVKDWDSEVPASSSIDEIVQRFGGRAVVLLDGSILVTLRCAAKPDEQAVRAARCVLALRAASPSSTVVVASGSSDRGTSLAAGAIVDRAASMLEQGPGVHLDVQTQEFLHGRFALRDGELSDAVATFEPPRPLLGRATPCLGRDKELALLCAVLDEVVTEPTAKAVLVVGDAGVGKTRVRQEFLLRERSRPRLRVVVSRGDPVYADSPFGLARQLVRAAMIGVGLHAHLDALGLSAAPLVAEFLAELIQTPVPEPSPILRAARGDAGVMGEQLERAFRQWLAALCREGPFLAVIEDVHWADEPSVAWLVRALRALPDAPLMLLVIGRPETRTRFPSLWSVPAAHEVGLGGLGRRAAEGLVRTALPDIADELATRIVGRADGNAFYLEQLVHHVATHGQAEQLPETIIAMAQARLAHLDRESRQVLKAASIYGETFWAEAVTPLVGDAIDVASCLDALVAAEAIDRRRGGRFAGQAEYVFHHGLLREAAYELLTGADRVVGHRLAGEWLEHAGERDPVVLAGHFEQGGAPARAVPYLVTAAQFAEVGADLDRALALVERGLVCGAEGEPRGKLMSVRNVSLTFRNEFAPALAASDAALPLLVEKSPEWFSCLGVATWLAVQARSVERAAAATANLVGAGLPAQPTGPYFVGLFAAICGLIISDRREEAQHIRAWIEAAAALVPEDPIAQAWLSFCKTHHEEGPNLHFVQAAAHGFERGGDRRGSLFMYYEHVFSYVLLGRVDRALEAGRAGIDPCDEAGPIFSGWGRAALALACGVAGEVDEPRRLAASVRERTVDEWNIGTAEAGVAVGALRSGDPQAARVYAASLRDSVHPGIARVGWTIDAHIALRAGRADEAIALAERGMTQGRPLRTTAALEPLLLLTHAQALLATGDRERARTAIATAHSRVLRLAATIEADEDRASYLAVPENAGTLELAAELEQP